MLARGLLWDKWSKADGEVADRGRINKAAVPASGNVNVAKSLVLAECLLLPCQHHNA